MDRCDPKCQILSLFVELHEFVRASLADQLPLALASGRVLNRPAALAKQRYMDLSIEL
jgi:hypothetical protein